MQRGRDHFTVPPGLERLARTPLAVAIGMEVLSCDEEVATARLAASTGVALAGGGTDPLALLPFVDQLASFPVAAGDAGGAAMSTIELAVQFAPWPVRGDVTATARTMTKDGRARLVTVEVRGADGTAAAAATAWFALGAPPGGSSDTPDPAPRPIVATGPFQPMIGLAPDGEDGARLAPEVWPAIGWVGMPALHGGAIAAALARAGQRRLETLGRDDLALAGITVRYLRAAAASGADARATVDALGRRTGRLSAALTVADEVAATAQLLFVAA